MPDITLTCSDCNTQFTFTEGEQAFFKDKGFSNPTRCVDCRRRRKAEKLAGSSSSYGGGNYGGGNYGGGGYDRGNRGGGRDRGGRSRDW